ncbi:uncharacterized protein [Antedon mediterranea]|uniref:uncharacterized protein n=1 Tax=Antedon mediterranea TaxID=105859 RepID=UPI003AF9343A
MMMSSSSVENYIKNRGFNTASHNLSFIEKNNTEENNTEEPQRKLHTCSKMFPAVIFSKPTNHQLDPRLAKIPPSTDLIQKVSTTMLLPPLPPSTKKQPYDFLIVGGKFLGVAEKLQAFLEECRWTVKILTESKMKCGVVSEIMFELNKCARILILWPLFKEEETVNTIAYIMQQFGDYEQSRMPMSEGYKMQFLTVGYVNIECFRAKKNSVK